MDKRKATLALVALLCCLVIARATLAQGGYELSWWTADGGGGVSSGGGYILTGTIGQPDAGELASSGYSLLGGLWDGLLSRYGSYLPFLLRNWR